MEPFIEVSIANEVHAEGISKVICDAIRTVNARDYPAAEIDRLVGNFTTSCVLEFLKQRLTLVALSNEKVVGTGSLQGSELKSLFVSPKLHRKGIGGILVSELEKVAAKQGLRQLSVSSSLSAVSFYSSLGYAEKSREFYGDEETVSMTKSIVLS
ncbi:GNAT family N-acetyltransferase [Ruegeria sp.]|uniref:GNAT family N-acetyltransferase n=1 Tax=Ruegeria sp. TaxID=1879320 RepID=UPI0023149005|nr:GNAT family N-acetyltransferase [Ruegeria sp.]MDA7966804.1 GNAT family N-acetyltransferase [Ruegeria sp.]